EAALLVEGGRPVPWRWEGVEEGGVYGPAVVIEPALAFQVTAGSSFVTRAESWTLVPAVMLAGAPSIVTLGRALLVLPSAWKPTGPRLYASQEASAVRAGGPPARGSRVPAPAPPLAA